MGIIIVNIFLCIVFQAFKNANIYLLTVVIIMLELVLVACIFFTHQVAMSSILNTLLLCPFVLLALGKSVIRKRTNVSFFKNNFLSLNI